MNTSFDVKMYGKNGTDTLYFFLSLFVYLSIYLYVWCQLNRQIFRGRVNLIMISVYKLCVYNHCQWCNNLFEISSDVDNIDVTLVVNFIPSPWFIFFCLWLCLIIINSTILIFGNSWASLMIQIKIFDPDIDWWPWFKFNDGCQMAKNRSRTYILANEWTGHSLCHTSPYTIIIVSILIYTNQFILVDATMS